MPKIIFLDTNIYLHYQPFDQINWLEVLKTPSVTIVLPPITIKELNKNKERPNNPQIKERASSVIKKLNSLFGTSDCTNISQGINIKLENREPLIDFADFQLNKEIQDDHLIASVITLQHEEPQADITLITSDEGLLLKSKAKRFNISTFELPDNYRLPEEQDKKQLRIKELERQIRELENRSPKLSLLFENNTSQRTFSLSQASIIKPEDLTIKKNQIQAKYPKIVCGTKPSESSADVPPMLTELTNSASFWNTLSAEDIAKYNKELDLFYSNVIAYFHLEDDYNRLQQRTIKLSMSVDNSGTIPAENVDVSLHFPSGFQLRDERSYPRPPKPPEPPQKPKTQLERLQEGFRFPSLDRDSFNINSIDPIGRNNVSNLSIKRTHSFNVTFNVQRIKHNQQEPIDPLFVTFDSVECAKSFHIDYEMLADNVPQKVNGQLHVIIKTETAD